MDADDLLQALAARERERLQARPAEWDELAHGRMTPDDAVAAVQARGSVDEQELARLRARLRREINSSTDQILIVDLGRAVSPLELSIEALGRVYVPAVRTVIV